MINLISLHKFHNVLHLQQLFQMAFPLSNIGIIKLTSDILIKISQYHLNSVTVSTNSFQEILLGLNKHLTNKAFQMIHETKSSGVRSEDAGHKKISSSCPLFREYLINVLTNLQYEIMCSSIMLKQQPLTNIKCETFINLHCKSCRMILNHNLQLSFPDQGSLAHLFITLLHHLWRLWTSFQKLLYKQMLFTNHLWG